MGGRSGRVCLNRVFTLVAWKSAVSMNSFRARRSAASLGFRTTFSAFASIRSERRLPKRALTTESRPGDGAADGAAAASELGAPPESLLARLGAAALAGGGGAGALVQLWKAMLAEARRRWDDGAPLPHVAAGAPVLGDALEALAPRSCTADFQPLATKAEGAPSERDRLGTLSTEEIARGANGGRSDGRERETVGALADARGGDDFDGSMTPGHVSVDSSVSGDTTTTSSEGAPEQDGGDAGCEGALPEPAAAGGLDVREAGEPYSCRRHRRLPDSSGGPQHTIDDL